ncbi:uncharacterized protein LOC142326967 [Lycorma delicatula]|uniref:uncharacterized protein LOC142326967 n=1 Tax=Lycorma delicatula TaxID=130591 RepID=UPI003F5118BB
MIESPSKHNIKVCYNIIVEGIVNDDVDKVVEILERNMNEIKRIMTNFKLYYLFYKTKSKEMLIILLEYFDVKNIFDIFNNLPSIITAAIRLGMDIKMIQRLIDRGGNINHTDVTCVSPLLQSIKSKRNVNLIKRNIGNGCRFNVCNSIKYEYINKNIIFNIIHNGADINVTDDEGYSPLIYAIKYECDTDVIIKLIDGADVNVIDDNGLTPLDHAVHSCMFKEIIQILIDNGVNINTHDEGNNTLLLYILEHVNYNKEHVSFVIQKGADVNICDDKGLMPIMYAVLYSEKSIKTEIISTLIENGADIDAIDKDGHTALCHAFFQRHFYNVEILILLLDNGATVSKYLTNLGESETPLIYAVRFRALVAIIIELLYSKEDITETVEHTSFLCKLFTLHVELAFLLISDHKDLVKKDKPLIFNIFKYSSEIYFEKLFGPYLDINNLDDVRRESLMFVLDEKGKVNFTKAVLEKRFYAKLVDSESNTLLHCTVFSQTYKCVNYIWMFPGPSKYNIMNCYDNIVEGIVDDDVDKVVEILERNTNEIKRIMTNFKLYYLFYKTKSKEMLIILLDYFDVKNIFDISNNLPSIITAAIRVDMDIKMIQRLIDRGGNINHTDVKHVSPLLQSIKSKRNINFIKEILKMGAYVNEICDHAGNSIIHIAVINFCYGDDIEVIKLLIDSGADVNAENFCRELPLMKLPLDACEDLWLELIKGRLHIYQYTIDYSLRDAFLTNVVSKKSRIEQFLDILYDNRFPIVTVNKICNRLLYLALHNNCCTDCFIEIINNGADVNEMKYHDEMLNFSADENHCTKPLLIALQLNRDKEIISALLDNGADVNAIDGHGLTPLVYAINKNYNIKIINKLINLGADVNKCDFNGVTPLMCAIKNINNEIIGRLINTGADVNAMDIYGRTSLCYAVMYCNDEDVINLLINKGADFSKISDSYDQLWFNIEVVKKSDDRFMAELITNRCGDIKTGVFGQTFLMYAIELNMNKNIIFNIIRNGADINATDNKGYSALIYSIKYVCDIDVVIKLIEHGADVNVIDKNGLTPLKHAVHSHMFKEIIQILIDNGVNINTHNENDNTLLLYILEHVKYNKEHVSFAIQKGADVNICDNNGLTPIMYAILFGEKSIKTEIIFTLIENGASTDAVDEDGLTALHHAFFQRDYDNEEILVLLLHNGASIFKYLANLCEGEIPLIYALDYSVKIVIELLYCKEDINENDVEDHTSFLCKLFSSSVELAFLLVCDHKDLVKKDKPLILNIFRKAPEIYVEKLFYSDLDINDLDEFHRREFMYMVNYKRIVKLYRAVLEKNGYGELIDSDLNTPLHFGSSQDEINTLIIYANVDVTARNKYGVITCDHVLQSNYGMYRNAEVPFIKHLLIVLPEELDRYTEVKEDYTDFISDCNAELNKMQSVNIVVNLSFFKFCCKLSEYEMNLTSESDNFCVYNDEQIKQLFPIYFDVIIMKIKKCKIDLSKRQLIIALERLIIRNRTIKSYDPKKYEADKNNFCSVEHSDQLCECIFLNYDILYCISKYLYERQIVNLLLSSL